MPIRIIILGMGSDVGRGNFFETLSRLAASVFEMSTVHGSGGGGLSENVTSSREYVSMRVRCEGREGKG